MTQPEKSPHPGQQSAGSGMSRGKSGPSTRASEAYHLTLDHFQSIADATSPRRFDQSYESEGELSSSPSRGKSY